VDRQILSALIGAVVGGVITAVAVLYQTRRVLTEQNRHREEELERETKSIATALLWEIDDFYKLSVRNVCRALKNASPSELGFHVKPLNFRTFTVFEATADKVGLYEPALVQGIVGFYGVVRAYLDTLNDYGRTMEQIQAGHNQLHGKAVTLLDQIKKSSEELVPLSLTVCEGLAERAKVKYTFEVP
jgi:hypothetical protein